MVDQPDLIFPRADLPTFFADGIANFANNSEIFKFYVYRLDPSLSGEGMPEIVPVAQIVMPLSGLFGSVAFLDAAVNDIVTKYPSLKSDWDAAKDFQAKTFRKKPAPT